MPDRRRRITLRGRPLPDGPGASRSTFATLAADVVTDRARDGHRVMPFCARRQFAAGQRQGPVAATLTLSLRDRILQQKRVTTDQGPPQMVGLAAPNGLQAGEASETDEGQRVEIRKAETPVVRVTGANLARLARHIGNHEPMWRIAMPDPGAIRSMKGATG